MRKKWANTKKRKNFKSNIQITMSLYSLGCTLSDCIVSLFWKILELENFELTVGICVGCTRSVAKVILQIKLEPCTQTSCLKELITSFLQD